MNVSESEFTAVADAANDAYRAGDMERARTLDRLARKISASLSRRTTAPMVRGHLRTGGVNGHSWRDVPSVLPQRRERMAGVHGN